VLHYPKAAANLISIQIFCLDNDRYFILIASHFYIFDLQTQVLLLEGRSKNGLYPLKLDKKSHRSSKAFTALLGIRTTPLVWHFRLGHPSTEVITRVVQENKLSIYELNFNKNHVCASCQLGKAKKHHFHASTRISEFPLQLIHTDLWTSPISSVSGYNYYVLFVDDYSCYSWIYPLHSKE
jgi:hypothetical protein